MPERKPREYQIIRLFATLGFLTLLFVLLFKVVLFAPSNEEKNRIPAAKAELNSVLKNTEK